MTNNQALEEINEGLKEILKESFDWCKADDHLTSSTAIHINKKAHELQKILERFRSGYFEE